MCRGEELENIHITQFAKSKGIMFKEAKHRRSKKSTWPFLDNTQRESPAFATTSCLSLMIATQAVLPEVGPWKSEWGP